MVRESIKLPKVFPDTLAFSRKPDHAISVDYHKVIATCVVIPMNSSI